MKKIKILYAIWLMVLAVLLVACSLEQLKIAALGSVRTTGFLLFAMVDLLCVLMLLTGHISLEEAFRAQKEEPASRKNRFFPALWQLLAFGAATALYAVYCFYLDGLPHTGSTTDALVAGGLFCAAAVFSGRRAKLP